MAWMTKKDIFHSYLGSNFRMTNIQAAIGLAQLEKFKTILNKKRKLISLYIKAIKNCKPITFIKSKKNNVNSYWLFNILVKKESKINRDRVINLLRKDGIDARRGFFAANEQPIFKKYFNKKDKFPNSAYLSKNLISLPSFPHLPNKTAESITKRLKEILS